MKISTANINELLTIWAAKNITEGFEANASIFENANEMLATIDAIEDGDAPWESFTLRYTGPVDDTTPAWKRTDYTVYTRNSLTVMQNMLASEDFVNSFDYAPYEEYTAKNKRTWSNLMSGDWAWKQADKIAKDPRTHGSMLCPVILGADKTTVSVATGNNEFHPVYISCGNIHNTMRRAHRDAVVPIAFLAIPKTCREHDDTDEFRLFRKQLYHASLAHILEPLRDAMTTPKLMRCPDRHLRRVVFEVGPFIADYPEQVMLAGIVQGWCPKCLARADHLEDPRPRRSRELDEILHDTYNPAILWHTWGVVADVVPFTENFPRADIHELLTPDLLHQMIKGTFKDHLVSWIEEYVSLTNTPSEAKRIMDVIDRRIAVVPSFPGLRRFPEGRNFKQWTGNDSKALMKVFIPAITGHVPDDMVKCISAFMDFCYIARCSSHDSDSLHSMETSLSTFHQYRTIFEVEGVRPDGFSLPRQHALAHYVRSIRLFGSPNGLCSSITESKHITAVKEPWRRSSKNNALCQILVTNTRMSKLAAIRVRFGAQGMLKHDVLTAARIAAGLEDPPEEDDMGTSNAETSHDDEDDSQACAEARAESYVSLGMRPAYTCTAEDLSQELGIQDLPEHLRRFIWDQSYPDPYLTSEDIPHDSLPRLQTRLSVFHSASAVFYAPSELSGPGGMHREIIRSTPCWRNGPPRYDTVLVQNNPEFDDMRGMLIARVKRFISFTHEKTRIPCAIVEWFVPVGNTPDPVTGMWIVKPELKRGQRTTGIIHVDCIMYSSLSM
ncbi:hypothetical protein QCA50_011342 [Cerrena zonata]|uniref:Uncharacterized protein n=1 Tax=Cerrena zonata TaxID=2478898 RepID=A0AAW0FV95_9APHY